MVGTSKSVPLHSFPQKVWQLLSSIRTGIVLLILVVLASAAGTFVLQRPISEAEQLQRAYSPETLRWLDATGLTDVFHSSWFIALMVLLCINIVCASIERFPTVWRFYSRPYLKPDPHFLSGLPLHQEIAMRNTQPGLEAAERALRRLGFKPRRVGSGESFSLYAERHRFARLAAYVVHLSLLLVLVGGIVDAVWGYRGFLALTMNEQANQIDMRDGTKKTLPFTVRCEGAGQENYESGQPKRWWSKLTVVDGGREVMKKEIEVNDPLTYRGLRFFQSSYGQTGQPAEVRLAAASKANPADSREFVLRPGETVQLDPDTSVHLTAFVPDLVIVGNRIESRSDQPNNPAVQLHVDSKSAGELSVWVFPKMPSLGHPDNSPYTFTFRDLAMGYYTGLQVSYEPGQWAVWAGVLLMAVGLSMAFYFIHIRFWAVPVSDDRGRTVLWVGASASKNREVFEEKFRKLIHTIEEEMKTGAASEQAHAASPVQA